MDSYQEKLKKKLATLNVRDKKLDADDGATRMLLTVEIGHSLKRRQTEKLFVLDVKQ